VVDPAVTYGWPEGELSMMHGCGGVPDSFFAAYVELHPLEPGWKERFPILHLRENLCVLSYYGVKSTETLEQIHATLGSCVGCVG
jgi:fructosamine-3-kinase